MTYWESTEQLSNLFTFALGMMIRTALFLLLFFIFGIACAPSKKSAAGTPAMLQTTFDTTAVFRKGLTGFILMDPYNGQVLFGKNQDNYFTPASCTKILTLSVCLSALGDSLDGIEYRYTDSTTYFRGTGDPTFLHPLFESWQPVYHFLSNRPAGQNLAFMERPFPEQRFGPGWAWDDYPEHYQPERSVMPVYGNVAAISTPSGIQEPGFAHTIQPRYFQKNILESNDDHFIRSEEKNEWDYTLFPLGDTTLVPFRTTDFVALLRDTLHRTDLEEAFTVPVRFADVYDDWKTIHSSPTDTVLRRMMYESDNLFAEQLLIMSAQKLTQTMRQDSVIRLAVNQLFPPSPTPPRWVDGSGLSRYNLITPRYLANVLRQLYNRMPSEKLFTYFPAGGVDGALKGWYRNPNGTPYVFAKSGSMSGVQCLSGYILTKSGKILIFSFMNNNFVGSGRPWKMAMQEILEGIYNRY